MGYAYILVVEEDLTKIDVPEPSEDDILSAWLEQGGHGAPSADMVPHIRHALKRAWLETHRKETFGELDDVLRWASDNLSWRPLLEDQLLNEILSESGSSGLHREFYSERQDMWFDAVGAHRLVVAAQTHPRCVELDKYVQKELDAFGRALIVLKNHTLRFRFDFSP